MAGAIAKHANLQFSLSVTPEDTSPRKAARARHQNVCFKLNFQLAKANTNPMVHKRSGVVKKKGFEIIAAILFTARLVPILYVLR